MMVVVMVIIVIGNDDGDGGGVDGTNGYGATMVVMVIEMTVMVEEPEVLVQSQNLFQRRSQAGLVNLTTFPDHLRCGEECK